MVRETRHLWIGNLPENTREERIREHFKRYGTTLSLSIYEHFIVFIFGIYFVC